MLVFMIKEQPVATDLIWYGFACRDECREIFRSVHEAARKCASPGAAYATVSAAVGACKIPILSEFAQAGQAGLLAADDQDQIA